MKKYPVLLAIMQKAFSTLPFLERLISMSDKSTVTKQDRAKEKHLKISRSQLPTCSFGLTLLFSLFLSYNNLADSYERGSHHKNNAKKDTISTTTVFKSEKLYLPLDLLEVKVKEGEFALVVEKDFQRMGVYKKDEYGWVFEKSYPVSTGKARGDKMRAGDGRTPEGKDFFIKYIIPSSKKMCRYTNQYSYGPWFMGLNDGYWDRQGNFYAGLRNLIAIHGTNEPQKIGTRASYGCIRLLNQDIIELKKRYAKPKTPLIIRKVADRKINQRYLTPLRTNPTPINITYIPNLQDTVTQNTRSTTVSE
jgi:hypothetical protein